MFRNYLRGLAYAFPLLITILSAAATKEARADDALRTVQLTLADALELARTQGVAAQRAGAATAVVQAREVDASRLLRSNPTLSVQSGPRFGPGGTSADFGVGIQQNFEIGGQRGARMEIVEADVQQMRARGDDDVRRSLCDVASAFLLARYAEERIRVVQDATQLAEELLRVARKRFDSGDVGILDAELAAVSVARQQARMHALHADRDSAIGALRVQLNVEPGAVLELRGDLLGDWRPGLDTLLAAVDRRGDLRALDAQLAAAQAEVRLGEAEAWPDVGFRLGYSREEDADIALAALSVTLPVVDHGQGLRAEATARADAALIDRQLTERAIRSHVQAAYDRYESLRAAVQQFERHALPAIRRTGALAQQSYEAGAASIGEVLVARRELLDAQFAHLDIQYQTALAGVELAASAGEL